MKAILYFALVIIVLTSLFSCIGIGGPKFYSKEGTMVLQLNADGTEDFIYGQFKIGESGESYSASWGNLVFFNDNKHFCLTNTHLLIFDSEDCEIEFILEDIDVDDIGHSLNYLLSERAGISYDDSMIAVTSDRNIYYLEMESKEHFQVTNSGIDYYPAFSLDGKIFFCRRDSIESNYKLMSINPDGSNLEEHCSFNERLSRIMPGQVDPNMVFLVRGESYFYKYYRDEDVLECLLELDDDRGRVVERSNDDNFFSFCRHDYDHTYIYSISDNVVYDVTGIGDLRLSGITPDGESLFIYDSGKDQKMYYYDFINNEYTYTHSIEHTPTEYPLEDINFAISKNGEKIVVMTEIYVEN